MANCTSEREHAPTEESRNRKSNRIFHGQTILFHSTGASLSQTFNKNFWRRAIFEVLKITSSVQSRSKASSKSKAVTVNKVLD